MGGNRHVRSGRSPNTRSSWPASGTSRFHESLKIVAREEYIRMMQEAVRHKDVRQEVKEYFGERLEKTRHEISRKAICASPSRGTPTPPTSTCG